MKDIDELCVKTIRFLAVDAVEKAKSGHPGLPLGAAPMAYVLWDRLLNHNPKNPRWFNRDRFVLSAGHGSALLYSLLHLYGYGLSLEEMKRFRQWGSKTPGHPEYNPSLGIEATTGPLGQGFAMGVGMAIAERFLDNCFNPPDLPIVDHYTYAIVSDGDLMEGISSEAGSLAGYLKLGKLIYLYDDNHISIEGDTDITFTEDIRRRFEAYGWQVLRVADGNDLDGIEKAIIKAQAEKIRPSLIIVRTHIGYGSPKQDSPAAHGEPLGPDAMKATKEAFDWPLEPTFYIPEEALSHFRQASEVGEEKETEWRALLENYNKKNPDLAREFGQVINGELPPDLEKYLPVFGPEDGPIATRNASGKVMNALAKVLPHSLAGGSGDLAPSTNTILMGYGDFGFSKACSHNVHFGVREHAMGAIVNGMALHGGTIPYGATFFVFSDYLRPALRLAALMQVHSIFVFTHDSIGLGEDGPTHQPIEHLMSLRAMPGMTVIRPADANETSAAWKIAIECKGPVSFALTRQKLPVLDLDSYPVAKGVPRGAYILSEAESKRPDIIIIATGSEVHLALDTKEELKSRGIQARVVSMPSWELFEDQSTEYKEKVLLPDVPKLAVEAGSSLSWRNYVGENGDVIGVDRFGASGPGNIVLEKFGFSVENVAEHAEAALRRTKK
ncbi:MAG: transketolase [Candidatus Hydrothermarchaeales archaeon]